MDAEFTEPGGGVRSVPAFWYRDYRRELRNGSEVVTATAPGEWRLRFYPFAAGDHAVAIRVRERGGEARVVLRDVFEVGPGTGSVRGFAQVAADRQYFEARGPGAAGGSPFSWWARTSAGMAGVGRTTMTTGFQ